MWWSITKLCNSHSAPTPQLRWSPHSFSPPSEWKISVYIFFHSCFLRIIQQPASCYCCTCGSLFCGFKSTGLNLLYFFNTPKHPSLQAIKLLSLIFFFEQKNSVTAMEDEQWTCNQVLSNKQLFQRNVSNHWKSLQALGQVCYYQPAYSSIATLPWLWWWWERRSWCVRWFQDLDTHLTKAIKLGYIWTFEYASNNFSSTLVGFITHMISLSFDRVPLSSQTRFCVFLKEKHVAEHSCSLCMWYLGLRGQCINQYIHNTGNLFTVLSYTGGGEERQALHPKVLVTYHVQPSHHSTNTTKANLYPSFANVPPHFCNLLDAPFWVHENCRFLRPKLLTLNTLT